MSADLALFALDPGDTALREDLVRFHAAEVITDHPGPNDISWEDWRTVIDRLYAYPNVEVGQVSWLKAGLFDDAERYVPGPVARCADLIGDGVLLTPGMAKAITVAFNQPNRSIYGHVHYERVRDVQWLEDLRRQASAGCRRKPWSPALRHPDIAVYRGGRGVESGRFIKRFLQGNLGAWLTSLSV